MKPNIYKRRGAWRVDAHFADFGFASFEGACRWAKRVAD
jgi:hypothetical protein